MSAFHKSLYLSASVLLLSLAVCAVWGTLQFQMTNRQIRSTMNEIHWAVSDTRQLLRTANLSADRNRPRLDQIMFNAELAATDARVAIKAQRQEWESPEYQRWRRDGFRAGEQATIAIAHLTDETLPRVDATIDQAKLLLANSDSSLNSQLLPEATKLLVSLRQTSDAFGVDSRAILAEVLELTRKGEVSLDAVNKVLTSPEWIETLKNVERSTGNIADATGQLPATAASVEKILRTSAQWQKPLMLAGLLATLARAFLP